MISKLYQRVKVQEYHKQNSDTDYSKRMIIVCLEAIFLVLISIFACLETILKLSSDML